MHIIQKTFGLVLALGVMQSAHPAGVLSRCKNAIVKAVFGVEKVLPYELRPQWNSFLHGRLLALIQRARTGRITLRALKQILPNAPVILDVGANNGSDSIRFATAWPDSRIITIEAVPAIFEKAKHNLSVYPNVTVLPWAIAESDGPITLHISSGGGDASSSVLRPALHLQQFPDIQFKEEITVAGKALQSVWDDAGLTHVDLIWIDLQGAELPAFRGLGQHLRKVGYIYTEVNYGETYEGNATFPEVTAYLAQQGFELVREFQVDQLQGNALFMNTRFSR